MIENEEESELTLEDVKESKPKEMWKTKRFFRERVTSISEKISNSYVIQRTKLKKSFGTQTV